MKHALGCKPTFNAGEWRLTDFWATVCRTVRRMLSDSCLSCLFVCDVGVLWPNGRMDQDETWHEGRPRPRPHCFRRGPISPQKPHPHFSAHVYCGKTAVCIRISLGTEVGLSLGDIVLDGDLAPPPLKGHVPQFSTNVRCVPDGWMD